MARVPAATAQIVVQAQGGRPRVLSATAQSVQQGEREARVSSSTAQTIFAAGARRLRVSYSALQVVGGAIASLLRVPFAAAQIIRGEEGTAMARVSNSAHQIVWRPGPFTEDRQRAWTFDFDGHTFYVLDLGVSGALIYDLTTGQWTRFETAGFDGAWNFKNGFHWRTGDAVVGGYDGNGRLLKLTPGSYLDEGWRPVTYEVRGRLVTDGVDFLRQYALRMIGSAGVLADDISPVMNMQFSDDRGETWSAVYTLALTPNTRQRVEFRSLGAFTSPGRIFRIYDQGGIRFISSVEADL